MSEKQASAADEFVSARDFLLRQREDCETACRDFRWPEAKHFNWALDYFDRMVEGNARPALWIVNEDGTEFKASFAEMRARANRTANFLRAHGIDAEIVFKVNEGRPHVGDEILNNRIQLVINTPLGRESFFDDKLVRRIAMMQQVPCITTLTGAAAAVYAIRALTTEGLTVRSLQEYHADARQTMTPKA